MKIPNQRRRRRGMLSLWRLALAVVCVATIGCAPSVPEGAVRSSDVASPSVTQDYVLAVGDVFEVKFFYHPQLNETVTIRPDGKVSLQLVDEIEVAGLTPAALDDRLTSAYSATLKNVDVAVIVRQTSRHRVFVGGEVSSPGLQTLQGRLTCLQAVMQAGGLKPTAEPRSVVILRNQGTQTPKFIVVNLKADLSEPGATNDIALAAQDIVFVPRSEIAEWNLFVDQYIEGLIPAQTSVGIFYDLASP